jgi:hypothetical protein
MGSHSTLIHQLFNKGIFNMCILIHHPKDACFTSAQLADFYSKNSDGFGAIVKKGNTVEVIKNIGTLSEIEDLYYDQVACHEAVIHFRMKTHGDIDIANCHPYEVVPGIWMAHNGVLRTGNAKDPKMSDTWHYIQDYLKPMLQAHPELMTNQGFIKFVGDHIGTSNKFALMNEAGEVSIINRDAGYDFWDLGNQDLTVWYSNTYAFSPYQHGFMSYPKYEPTTYAKGNYYGSSPTWQMWDRYDQEETQGTLGFTPEKTTKKKNSKGTRAKRKASKAVPKFLTGEALKRVIRSSYNAISFDGYNGALRWVTEKPMMAMNFLYQIFGNEDNEYGTAQEISDFVNFSPEEAADQVLTAWDEIEEDLMELGGITPTTTYKEFVNVNV